MAKKILLKFDGDLSEPFQFIAKLRQWSDGDDIDYVLQTSFTTSDVHDNGEFIIYHQKSIVDFLDKNSALVTEELGDTARIKALALMKINELKLWLKSYEGVINESVELIT